MMRSTSAAVSAFLVLAPASLGAEEIVIHHDAVGCVVAEQFPRFEAQFEPTEHLGRARLHFRPLGTPYWYSVAMTREGESFRAVMPKPRRSLKGFSYYIEATGADFTASRTKEYSPKVVAKAAECQEGLLAAVASSALSLIVEAPVGAPAIPAGFAATGVTTTVSAAGASGAASASAGGASAGAAGAAVGGAGAATGGGVSLGLVAGVVGGAAAVVGVAVAVGKGSGSTSTAPGASSSPSSPAPSPSPTPTPAPDLTGRWVGTSPDGAISSAGSCAGEQQDQVVVLTQTGSTLTGTYDGTIRVAGPPGCAPLGTHEIGTLAGTVGAGTVSFTVRINQPPGIKDTAVTGTFTANRMSGTFQAIGGNAAGTWSVNRQ